MIVRETIEFKRGADPKKSLDVGIETVNRDLQKLLQNFMEKFPLNYDEDQTYIHRIKNTNRWDSPIRMRLVFDSANRRQAELYGKRRNWQKWIEKNSPYKVVKTRKGNSFLNKKFDNPEADGWRKSGYGFDWLLSLMDK